MDAASFAHSARSHLGSEVLLRHYDGLNERAVGAVVSGITEAYTVVAHTLAVAILRAKLLAAISTTPFHFAATEGASVGISETEAERC